MLRGEGFARPNPQPMFPNPPGLLRVEPHAPGLRDRIWWGSSSNGTAQWAAKLGMNLQSSTLTDRMYFGQRDGSSDQVGFIDPTTRAIFGRAYADEPDALVAQLREDEAIAEADTLLLTTPNQLGVEYCAHCIESILKHVAPALGWR